MLHYEILLSWSMTKRICQFSKGNFRVKPSRVDSACDDFLKNWLWDEENFPEKEIPRIHQVEIRPNAAGNKDLFNKTLYLLNAVASTGNFICACKHCVVLNINLNKWINLKKSWIFRKNKIVEISKRVLSATRF